MPQYEYIIPVQNPDIQWLWSKIITEVSSDLVSISHENTFIIVFINNLTADRESLLGTITQSCPTAMSRALTKWAFRSRFTFEERMLLDNSTNPAVVVLRNDLSSAEYVDLDDPAVLLGFDLLIMNGIITSNRKSEILA
jgi:hypothetical protein